MPLPFINKTKILSRKNNIKAYIAKHKNVEHCGKCYSICENDENRISCKICRKCYHRKCLQFSKKIFNQLKLAQTFICSTDCFNYELPFYDNDTIDFMSAVSGEGLYPCKKCQRDCLENMNCISCSACNVWIHLSCTKLSVDQFSNSTYIFCSRKCENSVVLPEDTHPEKVSRLFKIKQSKKVKRQESTIKSHQQKTTPPNADSTKHTIISDSNRIKYHFLDVNCSYLDPNLVDNSYLKSNDSELVIFSNNIRSLNKNFHKVEEIFINCNKWPDFLAFTETHLNDNSPIPKIDGYKFEGVNSPSKKSDIGGVGIYIPTNVHYSIRKDLSLCHKGVEDLWVSINTKNSTAKKSKSERLIIGVIYRHHFNVNQSYLDAMCKTLHMLNESNSEYIIVGDVNINTEKYNVSSCATNYLNAITSFGCNAFIDKPTRVTDHSATCLDHVYSNISASDLINHVIRSDTTDHYATLTKIKGVMNKTKREDIFRRKTNLSEEKWAQFNVELNLILSEKLNKNDLVLNVNNIAECITKTYQLLLDKYMPMKKLSRKERRYFHKPWITSAIKVSIKKKNRLFKLSKRKKDLKYTEDYKRYRNILTRTKKKAHDDYYREKLAEYGHNKSKTWRLINEISKRKRNTKTSITEMVDKGGKTISDATSISNCLNKHFSEIGKDMASKFDTLGRAGIKDPLEYISNSIERFIDLPETTCSEIRRLILDLDIKKSCFDQISNKVIKATSNVIIPFLEILFNKSLETGVFPSIFKIAKVTPLHKGGDKTNLNNYRPISLLPCISKLFEKVISIRLLTHFDMYDLFSKCQFGFRESFTTEFAMLDIYEKLLCNLDKGLTSCAIFLDLAKAFDSVSHDILLRKLCKYGIRGKALRLFESYLDQRSQFVKIGNIQSNLHDICFGVPQGSILGPLLFLIYINDLPEASNFFIKLYADDTFLCLQNENIKQLETEVNVELEKVHKWLVSNRLTLNMDKSKFMIISKKRGA